MPDAAPAQRLQALDPRSQAAPLCSSALQSPPAEGRAYWLNVEPQVRLRVGYWPCEAARGTAVIFPGRTETIEKHYETVERFTALGFAAAAIDWRGQGLATRALADPRRGHVDHFSAFQRDADAYLACLEALRAPKPWVLVGHSMGGAISARMLMRRADLFDAAILSAPMLGLYGGLLRDLVSKALAETMVALGAGKRYALGCNPKTTAELGFEGNCITSDPQRFAAYTAMLFENPELALGGPSWRWVREAYREMGSLVPGKTPTLIVLGDEDTVVSEEAARSFASSTDMVALELFSGARHEPFIERDDIQNRLWQKISDFLRQRGL
ncbi:MAG: alpha/beta hydrolase [Neomegalonema sp.]|nr:alpha/beta hydrolase [Neomegalonema sp.]